MNETKETIINQLQQLQMLMHRASFHRLAGGPGYNPYRGQGRILAILKMKPEISQRELSYLLNMSKQALAELLTKLEKSGYITREPSFNDKRVMTITLTEKGKNATQDADSGTPEAFRVFDCLTAEELTALSTYLARIINQYEQMFPEEHFGERRRKMEDFISHHGPGFDRPPMPPMPSRPPREHRDWRRDGGWGEYGPGDPRCFRGPSGSHDPYGSCDSFGAGGPRHPYESFRGDGPYDPDGFDDTDSSEGSEGSPAE